MPMHGAQVATWLVCGAVFALILWRPRRIPEYTWAVGGSILLLAFHLMHPAQAWSAVRAGTNVYLFLAGMMLLAELARQNGVFDWLAGVAVAHARGSRVRLFVLVYGVGVVVTALLSNDATAVVLTPAVLAVVRRGRVSPLPYLFACAFVANAASFVLPISNPANLVVFGSHAPPLADWLRMFFLPAVLAIVATFALLFWHTRKDLRDGIDVGAGNITLSARGRRAAIAVLVAAAGLLVTSGFGAALGLPTCGAALLALAIVNGWDGRSALQTFRHVSWGIVPLVAGLFVMVEALNSAGALALSVRGLETAAHWPVFVGTAATAFATGVIANGINNLPTGLIGAAAIQASQATRSMHSAVLLGVDLGPNLSVTGSLATILWLISLRREGIEVSVGRFLRAGILIMPSALLLAVVGLILSGR